jgi:hypothetical protein
MEGREKLHEDKYKEITNDWTHDASYMFTSLPVSDLQNFEHLIFVGQSIPGLLTEHTHYLHCHIFLITSAQFLTIFG